MFGEDVSDVELKQRWRLYWIESVFEFSNTKLQNMSWIGSCDTVWPNDEAWSSSFEECMSAYFDTLALDDGYVKAISVGNVTKEEAEAAKSFHLLAYAYEEPDENSETILNDPKWIEVVKLAREFFGYLKATVISQREIDLINKLEKNFS